jgi:hypothetical protein
MISAAAGRSKMVTPIPAWIEWKAIIYELQAD